MCKVVGCEKMYNYYSSLRKHIRKTHPELKDEEMEDHSHDEGSHSRKFKIKEGKISEILSISLVTVRASDIKMTLKKNTENSYDVDITLKETPGHEPQLHMGLDKKNLPICKVKEGNSLDIDWCQNSWTSLLGGIQETQNQSLTLTTNPGNYHTPQPSHA